MVIARRYVARILVLAEDKDAEPLRALVRGMLRLVADENPDTSRIDFEASGRSLASTRDRKLHVELARRIATHLFVEDNFVFYHTDADRVFSSPRRDELDNVRQYRELLATVRQHIENLKQAKGDPRSTDAIMSRVRLLLPHYSIEAWLFQNTRVGRMQCEKHHGGKHAAQFSAWEKSRGDLDEIEKPKGNDCLGARFNLELASQAFPHELVYAVGKSFARAVDDLGKCESLKKALAATRAG